MTKSISIIKSQVMHLYNKNSEIHIDMSFKKERKHLTNVTAKITGIYPNVFTAILIENGTEKSYTFQYADLLMNNIKIRELDNDN